MKEILIDLYKIFVLAVCGLTLFFFAFYDYLPLRNEQSFYGITAIILYLFWRELGGK